MIDALPTDTRPSGRVAACILDADALEALGPAWDGLLDAAIEENAFFSRPYLLAGLGPIDRRSSLRALAVFSGDLLIALWPFRSTFFRYGLPAPVELSHLNAYQTNGTPLIHRDHATAAVDAILADIGAGRGFARNALMEQVRRDGPVAQLLTERSRGSRIDVDFISTLERPVLRPEAGSAEAYFKRHLAPKRLRDLARTHRRLGEAGDLAYRRVTEPAALRSAVEAFARIEAAGWKGRAGTAYACSPDTASYLRASFVGTSNGRPIAYADLLTLDGEPIAVNLNLQVGRTVLALKTTYDEAYRRFSPGLVLEYCVIRDLFETRFADEIDSCVTEGGHVLQSLWSGSVAMGTLTLSAERARPAAFRFLRPSLPALEAQRIAAHGAGKRFYQAARERLEKVGRKGGAETKAA